MAVDKNTVMKEAQKFVAKGQYDKAIAEWKKLLKDSPHDANLYNTIGDLCLKKNAKADAVDAYKRAADILVEDGFTSKAIALYKKVLNIDPAKVEVHLALGDMNADKGLTGNALESYKIVADHYKKQNKMDKALGIYQKMADLNPSNVAFRLKLAEMYRKEGLQNEAVKAYLDAADVHVSKNAFQDARQMFEKVLAIEPNNKQVYHKAGIVYLKEGKFIEACKALKPAFESDPSNKELADSYLEALAKAGKDNDAEQVIRKILAEDSGRTDLHEKLCQIYLGRKDYDMALDAASKLADASIAKDDPHGAVEILKKFVAACPHYSPGRQKLGELYVSLNRGEDAANTFLQAAEIFADEGVHDQAKAALTRALEISPDMIEAKELLKRLATSVLTTPPPTEPAEPESPAEAELSPTVERQGTAILEEPVLESQVAVPPATEQAPVEEAEDPAITSALTETDVLVKYGLAKKALEQLEGLARRFPGSVQVRIKLRDIYGDLGQMSRAAEHMISLADLYTARGMRKQAHEALQSALAIDPANVEVMSRLGIAPASAAPDAPMTPEIFASRSEPTQPADDESWHSHEPAPTDEIAFEGLDAEMPQSEDAPFAEAPVAPVAEPESQPFAEEATPYEEQPEIPRIQKPAYEEAEPAAPSAQEPATELEISEIWAEAEFYYQQGLFDEAKKHYAKIIELNPGERRAIARLADISREEEDTKEFTKLAEAVEGLEGALSSGSDEQELPLSASDEEAVRSLMSKIAELKNPMKAPPPQPIKPAGERAAPRTPKKSAPPRQPSTPKIEQEEMAVSPDWTKSSAEESFFDLGVELEAENKGAAPSKQEKPSDDFFDLASELKDELGGIAVPARPAAAEEQSLDEIFEEFKRGVEQQSIKEDVDTHYNLGVAYKEMGLLDDAIGEFTLTPEGVPKFVQSRYMLGLCYMEKGEYDNAIGELQNALNCSESTGEDEQSRIGMHYDLGLAYQGAGNISSALSEFQKVQSIRPEYRDTKAKLKELKQGGYFSLDQLKDDIEKEISAKFLEEGERIEREEKNRKNEKVKK